MSHLEKELAEVVGEDNVTSNPIEKLAYSHDLAPLPGFINMLFKTIPDYIVKVESVEEIVEVVKLARKHKVPIVPRGAATWGYGGAVPARGGIVLDLRGMNKVKEFNREEGTVTVECGVVWKNIIDLLENTGWQLPCYPSSAPSSTVGGWAATGGLGYGSLKYGRFKDHVLKTTIVLPNGETKELTRNSKPYNIDSLFENEGTLCIFADLTIKLVPRGEVEKPFIGYFTSCSSAIKACSKIVKETRPYTLVVRTSAFLRSEEEPLEGGTIVYGCYEGDRETVESSVEVFKKTVGESGGIIGREEVAEKEWDEKFYPLKIKKWGPTVVTSDVIVPIDKVEELVEYSWKLGKSIGSDVDLEVIYVSPREALAFPLFLTDERKFSYLIHLTVTKKLIDYAVKLGGRSYGYGLWNSFHLSKSEPKKKETLEQLKKQLDPEDILNPGKTIKATTKFGVPMPSIAYKAFLEALWHLRWII